MNLSSLRYVVEVGHTRSITRAAQNLYMGQPNLSKAIRELEREIGITIFRRTSKGVVPTPRGREFLGYAEEILSQFEELESIYKTHTGETVRLRVAAPRAAYAAMVFSEFFNHQLNSEQNMDIHFRETGANQAVHLVESGEVDFGVIRYPMEQSEYFEKLLQQCELKSEVLGEFQMEVMMSERHPLAAQEQLSSHDLAGYTEIVHGDYQTQTFSFGGMEKEILHSAKRKITVYDRGSQYDLLNRVQGSYMWTSPVPGCILQQHRLVVRPCDRMDVCNIDVLIYPEDGELDKYAALLADGFRRAVREWKPVKNV